MATVARPTRVLVEATRAATARSSRVWPQVSSSHATAEDAGNVEVGWG